MEEEVAIVPLESLIQTLNKRLLTSPYATV